MTHLCKCGKNAVWYYMPKSDNIDNYFCDDCVPRGCTCNYYYVNGKDINGDVNGPPPSDENFKWIEKDKIWVKLDEKGREYPCCEFTYEENGWEKIELIEIIKELFQEKTTFNVEDMKLAMKQAIHKALEMGIYEFEVEVDYYRGRVDGAHIDKDSIFKIEKMFV